MWLRIVAWRVSWSTSASTRDAGLDRPPLGLDLERLVVADPVDVDDPRLAAVPAQHAGVGDLAAALGVEGALLELDQRPAVVGLDRGEAGGRAQRLVADEARSAAPPRRRRAPARGGPRSRARWRSPIRARCALLLHQLLEALVVDREALLGEQLLGQVVGEAVGVVQLEGVRGVDPGGLRLLAPRRPARSSSSVPRSRVRPKLSSSSPTQRAIVSRSATSSG